jgi:hypothetical protein
MVALAAFGLTPADVLAELNRREGLSGLEEFAAAQGPATRRRSLMSEVVIPNRPGPSARGSCAR